MGNGIAEAMASIRDSSTPRAAARVRGVGEAILRIVEAKLRERGISPEIASYVANQRMSDAVKHWKVRFEVNQKASLGKDPEEAYSLTFADLANWASTLNVSDG